MTLRCAAKNSYPSWEKARTVLLTIKTRTQEATFTDPCSANRAYWCPLHKGWHLTKNPLTRTPVSTDVLPGDY